MHPFLHLTESNADECRLAQFFLHRVKMTRLLHKFTTRTGKILVIIIVVLAVIRILLPYIVLHYANKNLAHMKGFYGHIKDIDIWLIRGAYKIDSIYLNKLDSVSLKQTPFFAARLIDLSVEWKAILHGSIVGKVVFDDPVLRFTNNKVEPHNLKKDSSSFIKLKKDFMPLKVNRFEVNNGRVQYIDEFSTPPVDIQMTSVHVLAQNLRNSYDSSKLLPATVNATANVYDGTFDFNVKLNPLAGVPTYDINAELKNTNLVKLNEFFKAYAKVDVNKGTFGLYMEVAAKDGKFDGYVKPIIKDLDVLGKEDRKDNILRKLWEGVVGTVADVFTNHSKDQFATKIPLQGNVKDPAADVWSAIGSVVRNAFIQALYPSLDNEITIASVDQPKGAKKTFLQKVFGKKTKSKNKKIKAK